MLDFAEMEGFMIMTDDMDLQLCKSEELKIKHAHEY